jgi:hypothetical protein
VLLTLLQAQAEAPPAPTPVAAAIGGVKRRAYVEIDGRISEVAGYAEAEILFRRLKKEEQAQEQDRRKLKIHLKTVDSGQPNGALYKKARERVEVIEARMDDRLEKIAALYEAIQRSLDEQEEEEILLLI